MTTPTNFVSRTAWKSAFNYANNTRMPAKSKGVALHWEGTKIGAFTHDKCAGKVRGIESFHVKNRGWAGIAYNAIVCPHGSIFEGRGTKYRSAANGDTAKNNAHFAVCYLGGPGDAFTTEAKAAFVRATQWLRADGGAGSAVIGHRDVTSTECPGDVIEKWLKATNFNATTTPAPSPFTYKVVSGDTLSGVAKKFGLTVAELAEWNDLGDPNRINVGQVLRLTAPSDPKPPTNTTTLTALHWNIAGSQDGKYGAANATRGPAVGRYAKKIGYEVFLTCEASQKNLRNGVSTVLGKPWYTAAKSIWTADGVKLLASRKSYADSVWAYLKTTKYGAGMFGEKDGKKYSILEIHTDYRRPAKQAKQVQSIFRKFRADSDKLGIPHVNQFVVGDFNWDGTSGDNPFTILVDWNFIEHGSRTKATFTNSNGSKHLDGVLAHKDADVDVEVLSRADLSDHNPVKFKAKLR